MKTIKIFTISFAIGLMVVLTACSEEKSKSVENEIIGKDGMSVYNK